MFPAFRLSARVIEVHNKKVLLPKSRAIIGAKSNVSRIKRYTLGISIDFQSHAIHIRDIQGVPKVRSSTL